TVEEIWYFVGGRGEMWRKQSDREEVVSVEAGVCITIPIGTRFQFRSSGDEALSAVGVTMPPLPGESEAYEVGGKWMASMSRSRPRAGATAEPTGSATAENRRHRGNHEKRGS